MIGYVMDTSAWIEFFRGSPEGKKVTEYIFPELTEIAPLITSTLVLTEMHSVYVRNGNGDKFAEDLEQIKLLSRLEDIINERNAINAGIKHAINRTKENQISYVDCILWELAEERNMRILSMDKHFKDCPQAVYIKKEEDNEV